MQQKKYTYIYRKIKLNRHIYTLTYNILEYKLIKKSRHTPKYIFFLLSEAANYI